MHHAPGTPGWKKSCLLLSAVVAAGCSSFQLAPPAPEFALPAGISGDSASFEALVAAYPMGRGRVRQRSVDCFLDLCDDKIPVLIQPMGVTSDIDPASGPATPTFVAHLVNEDAHKKERYYKLRSGSDYYLVVSRNSVNGRAVWTLLEFSRSSGHVLAGQTRDLNYCHQYASPAGATDADFAEYRPEGACDVPIPEFAGAIKKASLSPFEGTLAIARQVVNAVLAVARSDGGWIYCSNGCCT